MLRTFRHSHGWPCGWCRNSPCQPVRRGEARSTPSSSCPPFARALCAPLLPRQSPPAVLSLRGDHALVRQLPSATLPTPRSISTAQKSPFPLWKPGAISELLLCDEDARRRVARHRHCICASLANRYPTRNGPRLARDVPDMRAGGNFGSQWRWQRVCFPPVPPPFQRDLL